MQAYATTQKKDEPISKGHSQGRTSETVWCGFIYPISDSEWVSPLVLVLKKNGKLHICVDYWEPLVENDEIRD